MVGPVPATAAILYSPAMLHCGHAARISMDHHTDMQTKNARRPLEKTWSSGTPGVEAVAVRAEHAVLHAVVEEELLAGPAMQAEHAPGFFSEICSKRSCIAATT